MKEVILTEESYVLINQKINAEKHNKKCINDGYIEAISNALDELKQTLDK